MDVKAPEWSDYEKFVAQMSWKSYRRYQSAGRNLDFDDIYQEAALAFVRATRTYKPELGYKFITYCGAAIVSALATYKKRLDKQLIGSTVSLDTLIGPDEDGYELIAGHDSSPLDSLVLQADLEETLHGLGPLGAQMIEWMVSPPPEVEAELEAYRWKRAEMSRRGIRRNNPSIEMDIKFLMGELLPRLIPQHKAALKRLTDQVHGAVSAWQI